MAARQLLGSCDDALSSCRDKRSSFLRVEIKKKKNQNGLKLNKVFYSYCGFIQHYKLISKVQLELCAGSLKQKWFLYKMKNYGTSSH
jgi:hypothetical protein